MQIEGIRSVATPVITAVPLTSAAQEEPTTPIKAPRSSQLPYISPVLQYDSDAAVAVLLFRDGGSGDVETQYPSKQVVREYQLRGREGQVPDSTEGKAEGGKGQGQSLLSLARGSVPTVVAAGGPGFGSASSVGVPATVGGSPTVNVAGGGSVNLVA